MIVRHILIKHQYEAEDLLRKIQATKEESVEVVFKDLAFKYSNCASAKQGGDLGDLSRKKHLLDQDFLEACQKAEPRKVLGPVRTKFGYHLIWRIS